MNWTLEQFFDTDLFFCEGCMATALAEREADQAAEQEDELLRMTVEPHQVDALRHQVAQMDAALGEAEGWICRTCGADIRTSIGFVFAWGPDVSQDQAVRVHGDCVPEGWLIDTSTHGFLTCALCGEGIAEGEHEAEVFNPALPDDPSVIVHADCMPKGWEIA